MCSKYNTDLQTVQKKKKKKGIHWIFNLEQGNFLDESIIWMQNVGLHNGLSCLIVKGYQTSKIWGRFKKNDSIMNLYISLCDYN